MRLSISETARLSGVSVRTLHYYDQIGLLRPREVSPENGYRWYGEGELARLRDILFYRELDFSLAEIGRILSAPDYDVRRSLERQKALLELKRRRLDRLLAVLEDNLKGERMMDFTGFDQRELDQARQRWAEEARRRWGATEQWQEDQRRETARTPEETSAMAEEMNALLRRAAALSGSDPAGAEGQALAADWQRFLTANCYPCTDEVLAGLGQLYAEDDRFRASMDRFGPGTADFLSAAIAARCSR